MRLSVAVTVPATVAAASSRAMVTLTIVVRIIYSVGGARVIVTVLSGREIDQLGRRVVTLDVDEGVSVMPCVIPAPATTEPVVVVRVEDLVVLTDHDLDARLHDGHRRTRGERDVDVGMVTAERECGSECQSDGDEQSLHGFNPRRAWVGK